MVMIAAAITAAVKYFGSERDDADDDVQGDDPIVRALFKAINLGMLDELEDCVHADCRITINALDLRLEGYHDTGFALFADAVHDVRGTFPNVRWELFDELAGDDDGRRKIAIRFVSSTEADGETVETEIAAFGVVEDGLLTEWHQVVDVESLDWRRARMGGPADDG